MSRHHRKRAARRRTAALIRRKHDAPRKLQSTAALAHAQGRELNEVLDEAPLSRFHLPAVQVPAMGFFTDAYDLFVIGIASSLIMADWHLSPARLARHDAEGVLSGCWCSAASPACATAG
jgi:hypothetical protein